MLCLDTYALVEINNGNKRFAEMLNHDFIITDLTMAEFYAGLYRKYNQKTADYWHRRLSSFCKPVPRDILIKVIRFRVDDAKKHISLFDSVGYIYALENNIKFVTADKELEKREGVMFVRGSD